MCAQTFLLINEEVTEQKFTDCAEELFSKQDDTQNSIAISIL
jgi:hypothetical protein